VIEVRLRALHANDVPALRALADDPDSAAWNPIRDTDLEGWITRQNEVVDDFRTWAVAAADDNRFLGTVSAFHIDREQGIAELGYRVAPDERGRGVATAALTTASTRLFDELGLRRLQLFHAVENIGSCVVAGRAGFLLEGTLRASYVYGDGLPHDEHLHARLTTDPRRGAADLLL
jgi:RimJ/RimL family protein N-acetyltransferase